MKDRLIDFLRQEQLTSAKFADMLGVQRSGVSHILSGRNNPGLDFMIKLLTRFPAVNAEWLITGKGTMYKEVHAPVLMPAPPTPDLFSNLPVAPATPVTSVAPVASSPPVPPPPVLPFPSASLQPLAEELSKGVKQISKIVIFYNDRTFGEYLPE